MQVTNDWDAYCKTQQAELVALRERNSRLEGELEEFRIAQDTRKREVDKVLMSAKAIVDRERQDKHTIQAELKKSKERCDLLEGKFNMLEQQFQAEYAKRQQLELESKDLKNRSGDGDRILVLEQQVGRLTMAMHDMYLPSRVCSDCSVVFCRFSCIKRILRLNEQIVSDCNQRKRQFEMS